MYMNILKHRCPTCKKFHKLSSVLENAKPYGISMVGKCPNCGVELKLNFIILTLLVIFGATGLFGAIELISVFNIYIILTLTLLLAIPILIVGMFFSFSLYRRS